ncbi:YccS family putative transporter [Rhodoferax sp.]|uniref:YccS family putative transporter n=1 Tax=Rhodoferax sp. TaxID=50421 RepID=UPI00374D5F9E
MPFFPLSQSLRRLWALDTFPYSLRIFIALSSTMAVCWIQDEMALVMPLFLGTIACALAETDDNWRGRLGALLLTLVCFALAAFSVQALFPHPWLFLLGMVLATFSLTMLGAISPRYQAIAYGTLILSIYTTIGMDQRASAANVFWLEPALLLGGATWYGLLSVLWCALFRHQPVQQNLAQLYRVLGGYLKLKATLFEPVRGVDQEVKRLALAQRNGAVVTALNTTKESILNRMEAVPSHRMQHYLRLYFIAQEVHERASSSHSPYSELTDTFFHSDVLFRCQRLLKLQGHACERLARAVLLRVPVLPETHSAQALQDLQDALTHLEALQQPTWQRLLGTLTALAKNLGTLQARLASASQPAPELDVQDHSLLDRSPQSLREAFERVRLQLTPSTPLFRHAVRLSLALAIGYGLLHWIHARQGYWILLTTLFVCQQSFGATRRRMVQRVVGTMAGLVVGWALFRLFPSLWMQAMFAVAAGVVFFGNRTRHYAVATGAMTLTVLLSFNQIGNGYDLIVPRMVDTLLGSLIAGLAVFLILPDWQGRRMHEVAARTLATCNQYLREIMAQYRSGQRDDLAYRTARRNAHNADAALSTALSNLFQEPGFMQGRSDSGLRFLLLSHTLLNYLSGLGAHREALRDVAGDARTSQAAEHIADVLEQLATSLARSQPVPPADDKEQPLLLALECESGAVDDAAPAQRVVQTQLALIGQLLPPLRVQAQRLLALDPAPTP